MIVERGARATRSCWERYKIPPSAAVPVVFSLLLARRVLLDRRSDGDRHAAIGGVGGAVNVLVSVGEGEAQSEGAVLAERYGPPLASDAGSGLGGAVHHDLGV